MNFIIIFLLSIIVSCSTTTKKQQGYEYDGEKEIEIPEWVFDINEACENKKFLCASAEGSSFANADLNSKKMLSSILEVKIMAKSQIKKFGLTSLESKGLEEKVSFEVQEEINSLLNGVKIINRFKKGKSFYSYAVLNKSDSLKILKDKVKKIDAKMISLYSQKRRVYINRLLALLTERNALKREVIILEGSVRRSPVSYDDIYRLKDTVNENQNLSIKVIGEIPESLLSKIEEELTSMGFEISEKKGNKLLKINFLTKDEYLNVKGFKKFSFSLTVEAYSYDLKKLGIMNIKKFVNGRDKTDALSSVLGQITSEMKIKLDKLNI